MTKNSPPVSRRGLLQGAALLAVGSAATLVVRDRFPRGHADRSARPSPSDTAGVVESQVLWRVPGTGRQVCLTFDDGPDPRWTPRLLDVLAEHRASATFFVVGKHAAQHPELLREVVAAGHEIGNHTWSHRRVDTLPLSEARDQLRRAHDTIGGITGHAPKLFRPPWGDFDAVSLLAAAELGYRVVLWSDLIRGRAPEGDLAQLRQRLRPGGIVLGHDGGPTPNDGLIKAFREAVGWLSGAGYALPTLRTALRLGAVDA